MAIHVDILKSRSKWWTNKPPSTSKGTPNSSISLADLMKGVRIRNVQISLCSSAEMQCFTSSLSLSHGFPFRASAAPSDPDIKKTQRLQWSDHRASDPACCCVVVRNREDRRKSTKALIS